MDVIDALNKLIPAELIDGSDVTETAKMVDLEIAFKLLVVEGHVSQDESEIYFNIPAVSLAKPRKDGKYEIRTTGEAGPDFKIYTADEMKVMRARFLLLKGCYATNIERLTLPKQNEARLLYEIHYIPNI